jgi:hypothetical protein
MKHGLSLSFLAVVACFCIVAFMVLETNPSLLRKKSAQGVYHPDSYNFLHQRGSFGIVDLIFRGVKLTTKYEGSIGSSLQVANVGMERPAMLWFDWSIFPNVRPEGTTFERRYLIRTLTPNQPYDNWDQRSLHTLYALRTDAVQKDSVVIGDWAKDQNTVAKAQYQWQVVDIGDGKWDMVLIKHVASGKCLQADGTDSWGSNVRLQNCNPTHGLQRFK